MKKNILAAAAITGIASIAHAQSSVTLYGILDDSIQFAHNTGTQNQNIVGLAAGNLQGDRWGMKGSEDLGDGLKTIFQLENGFNPNSGKLGQGGREFGRQAFVGLTSDQWGMVTLGRQYDPVVDLVQPFTADNYWGSTFTTPGDVDNNDNSSRTNNSVKFTSKTYSGLQFEGMYALGGVAGSTGSGQSWSAAATYSNGPIGIAAGYIRMDNAATAAARAGGWSSGATSDGTFDGAINTQFQSARSIGVASVAAQYSVGPLTAGLRYSNAQYKPDAFSSFTSTERYNVGAGFLNYQLTAAALIGLGYTYTRGSGYGPSASYNQMSLGGDYNLSKRTDVYLVGAYQHAAGTGVTASVADDGYPSNASSQEVVSLGIRHKF